MKILGLDVGEKRIGVAKVDSNTRIAVPVGYILNDGSQWQEIAKNLRLFSTNWVVLGLPRSNEGNETKQSLYVRQFAKTLTEKVPGVKIRFQDESLTSVEAEERLKARKKKYEKGEIDAEAAAIILQDFVESFQEAVVEDEKPASSDALALAHRYGRRFAPLAPVVGKGSSEAVSRLQRQAKKTSDKAVLNAKKVQDQAKKKGRKLWKIITPLVIIAVIAAAAGGFIWWRQDQLRQRQEYFAELEAAMQPEVFTFTIRPGETIFDVQKNLQAAGYTEAEISAAFSADYDFSFLLGRPADATLEGYLYGETYEFYDGTPVKEIIETFLTGMGQVIELNHLQVAYAEQGLSLYEGITLASVVQKEAAAPEMPTVAQVFLTRLNYGIPLGSDVTVSYALDVLDPNRAIYSDNQAALAVNSCYNTRRFAGLPCGPIASPSLAALLAVAQPSNTEYLYFLTGDDGVMYYSYTEYEHNRNAILHCQELCSVSL